MSKLLKTCLVQCLSSNKTHSYPKGPPGKQKKLSSVVLPLLSACSGVLDHGEKKYPVLGLQVSFARKKQTTQLKSLLTEDGLRGLRHGRYYYAVDTVVLFTAASIYRRLGFVECCDLTRMNVM